MPKISQLPPASILQDSDLFAIAQSGVTKKVTAKIIKDTFVGGVITEEEDPTVPTHVKAITEAQITDWDSLFLPVSPGLIYAGPESGVDSPPIFRSLAVTDIPDLSTLYLPVSTHIPNTGDYIANQNASPQAANAWISGLIKSGSMAITGLTGTVDRIMKVDAAGNLVAGPNLTDIAPATGGAGYIQNQNTAAQSATAWISGNFRSDGVINLYGADPRINFSEANANYTLFRTGTTMQLQSGGDVVIRANALGTIKLVNGAVDKFQVNSDGTISLFDALGLNRATSDPTAVGNGWIYYNTSSNQVRALRNGTWVSLGAVGDFVASSNGTHSGTLTMNSTPKITASNTTLTIEGTSSIGNVIIAGSATGPGVTIKKLGNEGQMLKLWDENAEASSNNFYLFGYKRTANYTSDIYPGITGYFNGLNINQTVASNFGGARDVTKSSIVEMFPLGRDGTTPTRWTKIGNSAGGIAAISVWKEYGNKTELYPDGETGTIFFIGARTIRMPNLATFADDAAAGAGGLTAGTIYKTSSGAMMVKL